MLHPGQTGVAAGTGEGHLAGAHLGHTAVARDVAPESDRIGAVERQDAAIAYVAGDVAGGAAAADLQCAGVDRRAAGIGVCAAWDQRAGAVFCQANAAGKRTVDRIRARTGGNIAAAAGQGDGPGAGQRVAIGGEGDRVDRTDSRCWPR